VLRAKAKPADYGPTRPERNGAWREDDEAVSRASICECHHPRARKLEKMCLIEIEVQEVIDAIQRRLAASGHSRTISTGASVIVPSRLQTRLA